MVEKKKNKNNFSISIFGKEGYEKRKIEKGECMVIIETSTNGWIVGECLTKSDAVQLYKEIMKKITDELPYLNIEREELRRETTRILIMKNQIIQVKLEE